MEHRLANEHDLEGLVLLEIIRIFYSAIYNSIEEKKFFWVIAEQNQLIGWKLEKDSRLKCNLNRDIEIQGGNDELHTNDS